MDSLIYFSLLAFFSSLDCIETGQLYIFLFIMNVSSWCVESETYMRYFKILKLETHLLHNLVETELASRIDTKMLTALNEMFEVIAVSRNEILLNRICIFLI